jgi:hypothetical protein
MAKRALRKWAMQVFMQIGPADATILDFDLDFTGPRCRVRNFLDSDVPNAVINRFFHENFLSDR